MTLLKRKKITARSTVNGLKQNAISQVTANPTNWYVSSIDAERIFNELTSIFDEKKADNDVKKTIKRNKGQRQQDAIITELKRLGCDPLELPPLEKGHRSMKAEVHEALKGDDLFAASTSFENAWQELTKRKAIGYKNQN